MRPAGAGESTRRLDSETASAGAPPRFDELLIAVRAGLDTRRVDSARWERAFTVAFFGSPAVRAITHAVAHRYGAAMDDVRQDLALTLLQKIRARDFLLASAGEFYAMARTIAERQCADAIRRTSWICSLDSPSEQAHESVDARDDEGRSAGLAERVASLRMSRAGERLRPYMDARNQERVRPVDALAIHDQRYSPFLKMDHDLMTKKSTETALRRTDPAVRYLALKPMAIQELIMAPRGRPSDSAPVAAEYKRNARHQEIFDAWRRSALSQEDFATSVGVSLAAFKSYIYGKTKDVPEAVLESARAYQDQTLELADQLRRRFEAPMPKILMRWAETLGLSSPRDEEIATVLGVSHTTVLRWRNDDTKPKARDLARYELRINAWASRMTASRKAAGGSSAVKRGGGAASK